MPYTSAQLTQEIEQVIAQFEAESARALHPEWITQAVVQRHPDVAGVDAEFWRVVGRAEVRAQVRNRLNRYRVKPEVEPDAQLVLAGFERLQQRYLVAEKGEQVAIRVQELTAAQMLAKERELRAMGAGCFQHADEMARFRASRASAA